ncbi:hypothetical protein VTL71DRAFT_1016 [Oculimacula yallundae]|uniref:Uncharacterized protein n=1 Tax=Oculimacula yallundae TaxID=86028 RepID=A0ABR4D353_9HELO
MDPVACMNCFLQSQVWGSDCSCLLIAAEARPTLRHRSAGNLEGNSRMKGQGCSGLMEIRGQRFTTQLESSLDLTIHKFIRGGQFRFRGSVSRE